MITYLDMKYMLLAIFITFFVALPMYLLNTMVMPQLQQLQTSYASADTIANNIAAAR